MRMLKRFYFAFAGLIYLIQKERNFRIHLILFLMLVGFGFYFHISSLEWISVLICSGLVLSLEAMNSAIEQFANHLHPEQHPQIKIVKDVSAGAVLVAAIFSAGVAIVIFLPKMCAM